MNAPKVTLKQLHLFKVTAQHESIARASKEVGLSPSAISLAIRTLEGNLGATLFLRRGKRLLLNDSGRSLLVHAHSMLRQVDDLGRSTASPVVRGSLRIGATPTIGHYLLPGLCGAFLQTHPLVDIELVVDAQVRIADAIESATLDIGFVEGPSNRRGTKVLPWMTDEMVFFCRPQNPLTRQKTHSIKVLRDCTLYSQPIGQEARLAITYAIAKHIPQGALDIRFMTNSVEAIKRAVTTSDGIGCLSRLVLSEDFAMGRLVDLKIREVSVRRSLSVIVRRDLYMGDLQRDFIGTVVGRRFAKSVRRAPPA